MHIVIAGGHGQIALLLTARLVARGDTVAGLIRNPGHAAEVRAAGGTPVEFDLEHGTAAELAPILADADAVVFAAGAGPGSGADRKLTMDRDGATMLITAAAEAGVRRYVIVSALAADGFDPASTDVFQIYLRAKSAADAAVRASGLDWTIVRPGSLTDEPATGLVRIASSTGRGAIPRADVAAVLVQCLYDPRTIGRQFEVVSGRDPIAGALA